MCIFQKFGELSCCQIGGFRTSYASHPFQCLRVGFYLLFDHRVGVLEHVANPREAGRATLKKGRAGTPHPVFVTASFPSVNRGYAPTLTDGKIFS